MKAMIILKRCRAAKSDIGRLQQRIDQWRDVLTSLSAPQADPNGGSRGTGDKDKTGKILADIDALEREIAARREAYEAERVSACALMDMVPDLEGKVLYDYYVKHMDTPGIARREKYTPGYIRKTKRNAENLLSMLGQDRVTILRKPTMGTEDFGFFIQDTPGCFWELGVRGNDPASAEPLHSPRFAPDEAAFIPLIALHAATAVAYLERE